MQKIIRTESEESQISLIIPTKYSDIVTYVLEMRKNVEDSWEEVEVSDISTVCCGYGVLLTIVTDEIEDGSYYFRLKGDGFQTAIEEVIMYTEPTETVSNIEGVKIIG